MMFSALTLYQQGKEQIEEIFGSKASQEEGFYKFSFPRTDLSVTINNIRIEPGFALTSWIAFHPMEHNTMIMGDLVLLDEEIGNVVKKLKEYNLNISVLHNHNNK